MKANILAAVIALGAACLAPACPPQPNPPPQPVVDAGTGGSPGVGGAVVADASPPACASTCCRSCAVLQDHGCPEADPTPRGATCETRCSSALAGPAAMRTPDVSACTTLACIRAPGKGKRGIACEGGR